MNKFKKLNYDHGSFELKAKKIVIYYRKLDIDFNFFITKTIRMMNEKEKKIYCSLFFFYSNTSAILANIYEMK